MGSMSVKWCLTGLMCLVLGICGCAGGTGVFAQPAQSVGSEYADDVAFFTKVGAAVALSKASMSEDKLGELETYLTVAEDLLAKSDSPRFDTVRQLALTKLKGEQVLVATAIIDVVERYVPKYIENYRDKAQGYAELVSAAIGAAKEAIEEYRISRQ